MIKKLTINQIIIHYLVDHITVDENDLALPNPDKEYLATVKAASRRKDFLSGRYLMRALLPEKSTWERDRSGMIVWPSGFVGSIAHTRKVVGCVIENDSNYKGVGIDIENISRFHLDIASQICSEDEMKFLNSTSAETPIEVKLGAVFCCKEALFKCLFPTVKQMFYFHDAIVEEIDMNRGYACFTVPFEMKKTACWFKVDRDLNHIFALCSDKI